MGNDGGSIPTRRELVKEAAKALTTTQMKEVQQEQQEYGWNNDPLTRKPLAKPVVSDSSGILYNKDSIIEYLLKDEGDREKEEMAKVGGFGEKVKSLKDVVEIKFEVAGDNDEEAKKEEMAKVGGFGEKVKSLKDVVDIKFEVAGDNDEEAKNRSGRKEKWVCPITGRELGPGAKAVYVVPCGHAFAGSVVKEVSGEVCLQCNEPYAENDVIPILPTAATDIARLNLRVKTLKEKGLTHALKKASGSKKRKKNVEKEANGDAAEASKSSEEDKKKGKEKRAPDTINGIKNASTASITRKVLEEQEERNKRRKLEQNANVNSLFSKDDRKVDLKNSADYMTRGFSIGKK